MTTKTLERQTADDLAFSLISNPKAWRWSDGSCDVVRGPGGISMSATYFTVYQPAHVTFGFWNKRRIRRAFRTWKRSTGNDLADQDRIQALTQIRSCLVKLRAVA